MPTVQLRTWLPSAPVRVQSFSASVQWIPAGRLSVRVTPVAVPAPMFSTLIDQVIVPPASTFPPSGVFVTLMSGHWTTTDALSLSVPSLVVATLAVLFTVPQSAASVVPWMWTLKLASAARLAFVQVRTSGLGAVLIEQLAPFVAGSAVQTMPAGNVSLTHTWFARPVSVLLK